MSRRYSNDDSCLGCLLAFLIIVGINFVLWASVVAFTVWLLRLLGVEL